MIGDDGIVVGQADQSTSLLQGEAGFYEELLNGIDDGVYFVDTQRRITFWSRGAERITGFKADEVVGLSCADNILMHVDDTGTCLCKAGCPLAATMGDGECRKTSVYLHHKDGHRVPITIRVSPVYDRSGRVIGGVETFHSGSSQQADLQRIRELEQMAYVDSLTGIANRRYLNSALTSRFTELDTSQSRFGLIMLDVDHFKSFNDNHGHDTGDRVLQMVASTLSLNCRPHDTVGRWGGEEFLILVGSAKNEHIEQLAEKLRALVASCCLIVDDQSLCVTASFGATMVQLVDDKYSAVERVDKLLYESKSAGRNCVIFGE